MGHSNLWGRINRPSGRPGSSDMPVDFGTVPLTDSNAIADYSNNLTLPTAHSGMTSNLRYTGSAIFFGPRSPTRGQLEQKPLNRLYSATTCVAEPPTQFSKDK
jgi:hypothetical protein